MFQRNAESRAPQAWTDLGTPATLCMTVTASQLRVEAGMTGDGGRSIFGGMADVRVCVGVVNYPVLRAERLGRGLGRPSLGSTRPTNSQPVGPDGEQGGGRSPPARAINGHTSCADGLRWGREYHHCELVRDCGAALYQHTPRSRHRDRASAEIGVGCGDTQRAIVKNIPQV